MTFQDLNAQPKFFFQTNRLLTKRKYRMSRFGKTTLLDTKLTHDALSVGRCVFSALQIIAILLLVWREEIWFAMLTLIELFVSSHYVLDIIMEDRPPLKFALNMTPIVETKNLPQFLKRIRLCQKC